MNLNREQEIAVRHKDGPLLIFAGAGSGKTRVITNRIIHLIERGVNPGKIVALSFTNKSAREMGDRIRKMIPRGKTKGLVLSTFHSLGLNILKKYIDKIGYKHPFVLQTPYDLEAILIDFLKNRKIDPKDYDLKLLLSEISKIKNKQNKLEEIEGNGEAGLLISKIYLEYVQLLKDMNSVDFDDLILLSMNLLRDFEEVSEYYHHKFKYFMVDEFQDTNQLQYDFIKLLLGENQNLCVVGDDDQSIYAFRGSNVNLILNFEKDFKETKVVHLLQNYRSCMSILNAANSLIIKNQGRREKKLWSNIYKDHIVKYMERLNEKEEAIFVIDEVQNEIIKNKKKGGEIAILFRTNYQSRPFEEELRLRAIPYNLVGGYNFFERKEIRDLISYIKTIANPNDEISLVRILNYPKRGIGQASISKIQKKSLETGKSVIDVLHKMCEEPEYIPEIKKNSVTAIYEFLETIQKYRKEFFTSQKLSPILHAMIKEFNFEREFLVETEDEKIVKAKMLNLSELVNMMSYFESDWDGEEKPNLFDFIMRLNMLMDDREVKEEIAEKKVQLMTMHLSKGLEFDIVFLVGIEEGIIPSSRTMDEAGGADEERRLMYVGMTRAREKLYLTSAFERKKYGETISTQTSRFIDEIQSEYIEKYPLYGDTNQKNSVDFLEELKRLKEI